VAKPREADAKLNALEDLEHSFDSNAYDTMLAQNPLIADKIERAVSAGCTPGEIKQSALRHTGNNVWAKWCEQAARWLVGE
jgi:hypothetical protein